MIVRCIANTGKALRAFEPNELPDDYTGKFGTTAHTIFHQLDIGKEYLVTAMIFWHQDVVQYLLYGHTETWILPAPAPLFTITEAKLSRNWYFKQYGPGHRLYKSFLGVMGYEELIADDNHLESLLEREHEAEQIFYKRVIEMEREFQTHGL